MYPRPRQPRLDRETSITPSIALTLWHLRSNFLEVVTTSYF